jgi:Tfp pilus assembly protein PilO
MNYHIKSIVSVILIVATIGLGYFLVWPKWQDYQNAKTALDSAKSEQDKLREAEKKLNAFLADFQSHSEDVSLLNTSLPLNKDEMYNILNNLSEITQGSGMTIGGLDIEDRPETDTLGAVKNSVQAVKVNFRVTGTYPAFKTFLLRVENNLRIMDVNSVRVQGSTVGEENLSFTISLTTYYQQ